MTKIEKFEAIRHILTNALNDEVDAMDQDNCTNLITFCDEEIKSIQHKAEMAKKYQKKKSATSDALYTAIESYMRANPDGATASMIADALSEDFQDISVAKVQYRCAKNEHISKRTEKNPATKTSSTVYFLNEEPTE